MKKEEMMLEMRKAAAKGLYTVAALTSMGIWVFGIPAILLFSAAVLAEPKQQDDDDNEELTT